MIYDSVTELIGKTPLIRLGGYMKANDINAEILAKAECFNPAGSSKDRVALSMIEDAERKGRIHKGSVIIEPTSGNTGIGLCAVCAARGYRAVIVMPSTMSDERKKLVRAYGAELVLTDGALGMQGAVDKANELAASNPDALIAGQFVNPANPDAHYRTTGPEIWNDTNGRVDIFIAGVGTGGTVSGVGRYLKEKNPAVRVVAVEPTTSPLISKGYSGRHGLQGIGANFIPDNFDASVVDEVMTVSDGDAYGVCRKIAECDGLLAGITSGAAVFAATRIAKRPENAGKTIVAFMPDNGERYLSTALFE